MDETPFYRKPIFWVGFWILVLIGIYFYQIITQTTLLSVVAVVFNVGILIGLFSFWMAFYAQFILPVRKLDDRSKIVRRLRRYISKTHGPALFIENGRVRSKPGELERKQAGVIWIDTASAAVTRTTTAYKQVLGPGIHFTDDGEYLAGWLDLHTQVQTLGPKEDDLIFQKLPEDADEEAKNKYKQMVERRTAASALTRDGIEVVPNITVVFRIDAEPPTEGEPGSRFGYNEDAVFKAVSMEGVNPAAKTDARLHVAWNQIPALIAADLWREYAGKFTLGQLFEASQPSLPVIPQPEPVAPFTMPPPLSLVRSDMVTRMLRVINKALEKRIEKFEDEYRKGAINASADARPAYPQARSSSRPKTALQLITELVKARMTQVLVPILDESGRILEGHAPSEEYKKIQERGLKVIGVSIGNPRLPPEIEERIIKDWNASWLLNAKAERNRIERRTAFAVDDAKQKALLDYTLDLSRSLSKGNWTDSDSMLLTLLERSRNQIIRDDRLRSRMAAEIAKAKQKVQPVDLTPAFLSMLEQSRRETRKDAPSENEAPPPSESYLDSLEQMIKRMETHDL